MLESLKNFFRSFWRNRVVDRDPHWDNAETDTYDTGWVPGKTDTLSITASPLIISLPASKVFKASDEDIRKEAYLISEKDGFKLDPKVYWEQADKKLQIDNEYEYECNIKNYDRE